MVSLGSSYFTQRRVIAPAQTNGRETKTGRSSGRLRRAIYLSEKRHVQPDSVPSCCVLLSVCPGHTRSDPKQAGGVCMQARRLSEPAGVHRKRPAHAPSTARQAPETLCAWPFLGFALWVAPYHTLCVSPTASFCHSHPVYSTCINLAQTLSSCILSTDLAGAHIIIWLSERATAS